MKLGAKSATDVSPEALMTAHYVNLASLHLIGLVCLASAVFRSERCGSVDLGREIVQSLEHGASGLQRDDRKRSKVGRSECRFETADPSRELNDGGGSGLRASHYGNSSGSDGGLGPSYTVSGACGGNKLMRSVS